MADVLGVIPSVGEQLDSSLWYVINASQNIAIYDKVISNAVNTKTYNVGAFKAAVISFQALFSINSARAQVQPIIVIPNMTVFCPTLKSNSNNLIADTTFGISSDTTNIIITLTESVSGSNYYSTYSGIISVFE